MANSSFEIPLPVDVTTEIDHMQADAFRAERSSFGDDDHIAGLEERGASLCPLAARRAARSRNFQSDSRLG